jgi:F420H(2)-dependent quinone reductase
MNKNRYSFFHAFVQTVASSRPGAWFYARSLHYFDRVFFKLSGGRATMTGALAGLPVVILTTTGAKSGLPRTLPLLCIRDERNPATFALVAGLD